MSKTMKGTLMTLIAGIAWGLSGACGQYLMGHGFTAIGLTTIRLVFSGAVLLLLAYLADHEKVKAFLTDRSSYIPLLLFAFLGLLMTQLTYLEAIDATNAGTATVLQYLCPIGVLAYSCVKDRVAPTVSEIFSMILAIAGTFLIATHGQLNQLAITPKGLAWGLISAFAYALYIILPIQLIQKWGSMLVIGIGMLIPGLVMIPFTGRRLFHGQYSMDNLMGLVGLVVIGTIFAYTVFLKGTTLIGPVKGSLLAAIEPISAVFFAFAIMNEHFFAIDFIGMAMILFAVLLISLKDLMIQKEKGIL
ncbi:DMT family transporter [Streptococcus parasanguinis]|uniref:DMT family transporter n=1 Tax=Streptococcus parasanguinis TaxID=1318 RepID=UPI0020C8D0F7|nr:DMT family transporter [Streptococcus parasanguinis]MCP9067400.1 DMT family transporter [Streptococcus parasanguinis]